MRSKTKIGKGRMQREERSPLAAAVASQDKDLMRMVDEAIRHKQVRLAFQPIVQSGKPGNVVFHEGLIRVLDAAGRVIPAADFMEAVEESELGRRLDCLSLEKGLSVLAANPGLRLSINMSARSIGYGRWNALLRRGLKRREDIAERLILEISEKSVLQLPDLITGFMQEWLIQDVSFAMDDFGGGLTSFAHFRDFDFQFIKLDGSYSRDISQSCDNQVLASAIAAICSRFGIAPIASHVETVEDAETLHRLGLPYLQGYLFGAPSIDPPWYADHPKSKPQVA